jgi:hypothetical protein
MKLYNFIIGELLELANREFRSEEFYKLKDRILKDLGTLSGHNTQHIVRLCHTCGGSGRMPEKKRLYGDAWISKGSPCYRCSGSGKHDEFWVLLEVYKVGSRLFHLPTGRQYSSELFEKVLQSASIVPQKHFEGLIRPIPPRFHLGREAGWWLILLFDRASLHSYYFGKSFQYGFFFTPLLIVNNILYYIERTYYKIRNSLVSLKRKHCRHDFPSTNDPWASDVCQKCGVERWELQENEPIF